MVGFWHIVFLLVPFLSSCSSSNSPEIKVENVWSWPVEAMLDDQGSSHCTGVVYLTIVNKGGAADRLIAMQTEVAEVIEFHETGKQGSESRLRRWTFFLSSVPGTKGSPECEGVRVIL